MNEAQETRRLAAIMSADAVGYSRLMRADDEATVTAIKLARDVFARQIASHRGRLLDTAGDSVLAEFASAMDAVNCSLAAQEELTELNAEVAPDRQMLFRIGINLGDVIADGETIYGDGVNVAARLQALAEPGGVCISGAVYDLVRSKLDLAYEFAGRQRVKNIDEPVPLYRIIRGQARPVSSLRKRLPTRTVGYAFLGVVVLVLGAWMAWKGPSIAPNPTAAHSLSEDSPSLIVLPFANLSNDPGQEYFSDGITGDITTDLSRLGAIRVIARHTASSYKGQNVTVQDVARELGVRYVIDGSVQKSGTRVRINVQLTDTNSAHQVWAERFDRAMGDLFAVQDEIATHIVDALAVTLSEEQRKRIAHRYTNNVEAYDLFLRGQELYVRQNPQDNPRAQELFRKAIALDRNFSRAYAALALTYSDDWRFQWSNNAEQGADEALRLARRAVELDSDLPQAQWALGFVHIFRREHDEAIRAANRAIALDPNNADAYVTLAISTAFAGHPEQAIPQIKTAMALNPHYGARYPSVLGIAYYLDGEYNECISVNQDAIARNPERTPPRLVLAAAYIKLGRQADAEWQVAQVLNINPEFTLDKVERIHPFKNAEQLDAYKATLRQAGFE